jgi:hypothetical protein
MGEQGRLQEGPDPVLGSTPSAPNISVWWNKMPTHAPVTAAWTYQRNALSSALSIAAGPVDTSTTGSNVYLREDIVTALAAKPSGQHRRVAEPEPSGNEASSSAPPRRRPVPTLYQTNDAGDANQILLEDCASGRRST